MSCSFRLTYFKRNRSSSIASKIFDRNYIVKYLGLDAFTAIDGVKTAMSNEVRAEASSNELPEIMKFTKQNNLPLNPQYAGIAKGKMYL